MIYKNTIYNKINEDFDFNKIKSKRIEDDYQLSPEVVRLTNKQINPYLLINIQYGIKYPSRLAKSKRFNNTTGEFYYPAVHNDNLFSYPLIVYSKTSYGKQPRLTIDEDHRITDAKFIYHCYSDIRWMVDKITETDIPEWFKSLVIGIYSECNINIDFDKPKRYTYYMSPDEGIVIITELAFNIDDLSSIKSGIQIQYPIIAYTGLVLYEYNKFKTDNKAYNKAEKLNLNIKRFTKAILNKYSGIFKYQTNLENLTPIIKNDHIILYNNASDNVVYLRPEVSKGYIKCVKDIFFNNSQQSINPFIMGILGSCYLQEFKNILYKSNDDNTNTIAGYISDDGLICIYFVNDYDTLIKLIGKENVDKAELISYELGKNLYEDGSDFYTYMFWYVTDKGMELFDLYNKGLVTINDIKSEDYVDKL